MGCSQCHVYVSDEVYDYSKKRFGKVLCRDCQKGPFTSKSNRKHASKKITKEAKMIYDILRANGFKAELEKWDGHKHIDIAITSHKVNIEVDGKQHIGPKQALADLKRTFHSFKKGYVTLRIPNSLVQNHNLNETAKYIMGFLDENEKQLDAEVEDEDDDW